MKERDETTGKYCRRGHIIQSVKHIMLLLLLVIAAMMGNVSVVSCFGIYLCFALEAKAVPVFEFWNRAVERERKEG